MIDHIIQWRPTASLEAIKKRAELLEQIRAFFYTRNILEVDTPVLSSAANTDPNIESFCTDYTGPGKIGALYMQTSPEFAMKRLLAAGSGAIYQLCKVFRNGEVGRQHNPEFTMLEWYRPKFDHHQLMDEVEALLDEVLGQAAVNKISYQKSFLKYVGVDPLQTNTQILAESAAQHGLEKVIGMDDASIDTWCDLIMDQIIVPSLGKGRTFIFDYPASQAALARISSNDPRVAERFELFIDGVEIANGFHELTNVTEQRYRFIEENNKRHKNGLDLMPIDNNLLAALEEGLPECAGVALGIDRLLMLMLEKKSIKEIMSFDTSKD